MRDQVFLCSSQAPADEPWRQRLRVMLQPLVRQGALRLWDRTSVPTGARWEEEIERALARARVALVLVSADLLAADDLAERELPVLLRAAEAGTLRLLWVPVRASLHEWSQFAPYQPVHPPERPLAELSAAEQDQALVKIAEEVQRAFAEGMHPLARRHVVRVVQVAGPLLLLGLLGLGVFHGLRGSPEPRNATPLPAATLAAPGPPPATTQKPADREQHIKGRLMVTDEGNAAQDVEAKRGESVRQIVEGDVVISGKGNSGQRVRSRAGGTR